MPSRSDLVRRSSLGVVVLLLAAVVVGVIVARSAPKSGSVAGPSSLVFTDGWARATTDTPQPTVSAVYGSFANPGPVDRVLVAASTSAATSASLQRFIGSAGTPLFEAVAGLTVPAGGGAELTPDGVRVLLLGAGAVEPEDTVYVQFVFDDGSVLNSAVQARVFEEVDLEGGWWHGDHFHPAGDDSHGPPPSS